MINKIANFNSFPSLIAELILLWNKEIFNQTKGQSIPINKSKNTHTWSQSLINLFKKNFFAFSF